MAAAHQQTDHGVGRELQSLRIYPGLPVEEAARHLDLEADDLAAYEAGRLRPTPPMLLSTADCDGVHASRLFGIIAVSRHIQ